jgi:hypothetical protein
MAILTSILATSLLFATPQTGPKRRFSVLVVIPEQHLTRRIPDPAAQTEIVAALIDAGYKVIDGEQARRNTSAAVWDRIAQGGPKARDEARRLGAKVGAEVVVTGEAFSQLVTSRPVETDLGNVTQFIVRARIELRAYRVASSEIIFSGDEQITGAPELTEELGSKESLKAAAEAIAPRLLDKLDKLSTSTSIPVEIEVRNVSFSQGNSLREALRKALAAVDISEGDYESGTWKFEVSMPRTQVPRITVRLETNPYLRKPRFSIQSANKTKVILVKKG